jgi:acyl-CoA reductase-like NAD-dependent aldehyde dehydrogenase
VNSCPDDRLAGLLPVPCLSGNTLWIGGQWWPAASRAHFTASNPATGKPLTVLARGTAADVDRAARAAELAAPAWAALGGSARGAILRKAASAILASGKALGMLDTLDSGRPISDTIGGSVEHAAGLFDYYAGLSDKIHGSMVPMGPDTTGRVEREPCGVVGAISPWNYPLQNAATKIAPILACGNTLVLKPAEQTSLSVLLLAQLMDDAGLPPGVLNVVTGFGHEAGAALVEHPAVSKISFTGSTATGRRIAAAAGERLKSVVLELGGKSPLIVFDDADLAAAARAAVFSTFMNCGQTCTSCNRVLVARALKARFEDLCREAASSLRVGNPLDPLTQIGPIISAQQLERVNGLLDGVDGERLGAEGYRPCAGGHFFQPVMVGEFDIESRFAKDEIFGPVMSVRAFDTDEEAYSLANDSQYGLATSVWTTSLARSEEARRKLRVGIVWINCVHTLAAGTPVSGHKASGLGIEYGLEAVEEYMRVKTTVTMRGGWSSPFAH